MNNEWVLCVLGSLCHWEFESLKQVPAFYLEAKSPTLTLSHELSKAQLTFLNPPMFINTRESHPILKGQETTWAIDQLPVTCSMDSMKLQRNFFIVFFKFTFKLFFSLMKSFYFNKDFDVSGGIKGVFEKCIQQVQPFILLLIEDLLLIM